MDRRDQLEYLSFFFLVLKHFLWVTSAKSNRASSSENSLLVKSSEKTGKNGQNEHFETLKINQRSTETQGALLQEKQLNLSTKSKLHCILMCLSPVSSSPAA